MYSHNYQKNKAFYVHGKICELYIGQQMSIKDIAEKINYSPAAVSHAIARYFKREEHDLKIPSHINSNKLYINLMWYRMSNVDLAAELKINLKTVYKIAKKLGLPNKKTIKSVGGRRERRITCLIFNEETGLFYDNISEVARTYNVNRTTLRDYFTGRINTKRHHKFKMLINCKNNLQI